MASFRLEWKATAHNSEREAAMVHMGIDLHKTNSYVVVLDDAGRVVNEGEMKNAALASS